MLVTEHTFMSSSLSVDVDLPNTANAHFAQATAPENMEYTFSLGRYKHE